MKVRGFFKWKTITLARGQSRSSDYGYLGAAQLLAMDREQVWLGVKSEREHAVGWVKATDTPSHQGVLLWPVWDAELGALPYLNGWWG